MSVTNQNNNDEIDLLELFDIIWRGKWLIAIPSLLVALITFLYLSLTPTNYSVTLQITPLSPFELDDYAPLNNIPGSSTAIYEAGNIVGYEEIISSQKLLQAVRANFLLGADLRQTIEQLTPEFQGFIGSQEEKQLALSKSASAFTLEAVRDELGNNETLIYVISTETKRADLTRQILRDYVELIKRNIRIQNLRELSGLKKSTTAKLAYERQNLEAEIENTKQAYLAKLQSRIAILPEQASIARALNLADPSQNLTINTSASTNAETSLESRDENLFRNGYKALDAEIKLLQQRDEDAWRMFMPSYVQIAEKLRKIESDRSIHQLDNAIAASPLNDGRLFAPANFDFENLLVEPKTNKPLIMILATLLAALLAAMFVLGRHYIGNQSSREI